MIDFSKLINELRHRGVLQAAGIYIVAAWVVVQVASLVFPAIDVPDSALRYVWLAAIFLFPLAIIASWRYDVTMTGIVRTPPSAAGVDFDTSLRRGDIVILLALTIVAAAITWDLMARVGGVEPTIVFDDSVVDPNTIAVLPLENLSRDPDQQYFVSGMQDALISSLSRIKALRVTSKTSTQRFAGSMETLTEIGAKLGVAHLIEGSVYRVGDRIRIDVKLIDARLDEHVWSDSFEEKIEDVLALQNQVARSIAREVEVTVSPGEVEGFGNAKSVNPAAYEAFLRGQFFVERFTPQDMQMAANYYQQAIALDPDYALAHHGLATLCRFQAQAGLISPEKAREHCLPPVLRALELGPDLAETQMGYASYMTWQAFDWAEGGKAFRKSIDLNPSYAEARYFYSHYLALMGDHEESSEQMRIALTLDPYNPFVQGLYGAQLFLIGELEQAIDVIDQVMAANPGFGFGYFVKWQSNHYLGRLDESIAAAMKHFSLTRGDSTGADALRAAYIDGDYAGALTHAAAVLTEHSKKANVPPMNIGKLYEFAGETELAIDWFERSFASRDPDAPYLGANTLSQAVRSHPRFIALMRDMGHEFWAEQFVAESKSRSQ